MWGCIKSFYVVGGLNDLNENFGIENSVIGNSVIGNSVIEN